MKTKTQFTKQLLSIFLCVAILLTFLPTTAPKAEADQKVVGTSTIRNTAEKQSLTLEYKNSYLPAPNPAYSISGYSYYDETNKTYWFKGGETVTVNAPVGFEISKTLNDTYSSFVTFSDSEEKTVYLRRISDGALTDEIKVENVRFDENGAVGKITIEPDSFWATLLKKLTFELYFSGNTSATVTATDADSGVKSIQYYVANEDLINDNALDTATAVAMLENEIDNSWNTYNNKIVLKDNSQNVIYVKITDNVGYVTYISSNGIVMDSIAPTLEGIENGQTYYGDLFVIKSYEQFFDIKRVTLDGAPMDFMEGTYGIVPADNKKHTVVAEDYAGNKTTYTVTVYKKYSVTFVADGNAGSYEKDFKYGEVITIPTNEIFEETFRKTGYTITGWQGYTEGMTMPLENLTFTAVYTPNKYTTQFDANGGEPIAPITVTFGEKYGKLPSSAITGLSGGDSNWYLVDENGNVTDTKITKLSTVSQSRNHTLFIKRSVLSPTISIALTVPGGISDGYQYYIPGASERVLTATIGNMNTNVLDYTYQWYKDGTPIEGANSNLLTLDGNVSDSGTYKVEVTATLKSGTNIIVTSASATAYKEQKVKILHATNTLNYNANGGEGGPQSSYTGGTSLNISKDLPTKEHYDFVGWNTMPDGTGDDYFANDAYTFANDGGNGGCVVILYAKWKAKEYTVTYMVEGEPVSTEKVEYSKNATLPEVPQKDGYVGKWNSDGKNIVSDTTISAVYTAITVAVKPDEVTPEDKADLEDNKAKLEEELKDNSYTKEDKKEIQNAIDSIDKALEVIENVEAVGKLIDKLPDTITKNDEAAIKAADDALSSLTDYEKSLVGEAAKQALEDAKAALAELNKPSDSDEPTDTDSPADNDESADSTSPQTGDNFNLWVWFALLFASGTVIFGITLNNRKRKANNK